MGLILDSSVVIAAGGRGDTVTAMLKHIVAATGDQRALSAVGLTELAHSIYRAQTAETRNRHEAFLNELLNDVDVYPLIRKETALPAGKIDGEQRRRGVTIPFADLLIGAMALEGGYSLLTVNARYFQMIPGLSTVQF
jgi:predicted nucleic acid-binding protein